MRKCKVCGDPGSNCGTPTVESIIGLDIPTERNHQMAVANYRVKRYINGILADVAVTSDELTDHEKKAFGLTKSRSGKNKARQPTRNKAANLQLEEAGAVKSSGGWWTLPVDDADGNPIKVQGTKAALAALEESS